MRTKIFLTAVAVVITLIAITFAIAAGRNNMQKAIVGLTPREIKWFTPPYYTDGRQRAQLFGDSNTGGVWVDRVKLPTGARALAHTHPADELVTVIEGTWYLGEGEKFDATRLKA